MKPNKLHISVSKPCQENWDDMNATDHGAFCQSCQKEVIDFSAMTDREVITYVTKAGRGCGKFRADQLEAPLVDYRINNGFMKWKALILGLLPIFAFKTASASLPASIKTDQNPTFKKDIKQTAPDLPAQIKVTGTVTNEKGVRMKGATIQIIDTAGNFVAPSVLTDDRGRFSIQIDRKAYKDNLPILRVNARQYSYKTQALTIDPVQRYDIKMGNPILIMGDWAF